MAEEAAERGPRAEAIDPDKCHEDRDAGDFPELNIRVVKQRIEPDVRGEALSRERPSVGRVQDDLRQAPHLIQEKVRCHTEADEAEEGQSRDEAQRQDRVKEQEGMRPSATADSEKNAEGLVDEVRQDRAEQDQPVVDARRRLPGEKPCEAETNPQVAEKEQRARYAMYVKSVAVLVVMTERRGVPRHSTTSVLTSNPYVSNYSHSRI